MVQEERPVADTEHAIFSAAIANVAQDLGQGRDSRQRCSTMLVVLDTVGNILKRDMDWILASADILQKCLQQKEF
ncbi:hypothetical protein ACLKA6_018777 [Drosophila palustris]